jgi:putative oxidoreductase
MTSFRNLALLAGRIMIAGVFIYDAWLLFRFPEASIAYMVNHGIDPWFYWPTIVCEFVGGVLIVVGYWTRLAALAFAAFCVTTALVFHTVSLESDVLTQFGKDMAIAAGFLFLAIVGPGRWSVDRRLSGEDDEDGE